MSQKEIDKKVNQLADSDYAESESNEDIHTILSLSIFKEMEAKLKKNEEDANLLHKKIKNFAVDGYIMMKNEHTLKTLLEFSPKV